MGYIQMSRNVESIFGAVVTAPHQIPFTYNATGGETYLSLPFYPVTGVITINGGVQVPVDNYEIDGNTVNLGRALEAGDVVYCLFDKVLSPEDYQNGIRIYKFQAVGNETSFTPDFTSYGVQSLYIDGKFRVPGVDYNYDNTTGVVTFLTGSPAAGVWVVAEMSVNQNYPALSEDGGAAMIGAHGGTVQEDLIKLKLNWAIESGYSDSGLTFRSGGTLGAGDGKKVVYDPVSGEWYSWAGSLPLDIPAGTNPVGVVNWIPQTDPSLRNDLAEPGSQVLISGETAEEVSEASKTAKLLSQYAHVHSYAGDNAKIIGILEKENCSFEGGQLDINDSFDFSDNKRIRVNKDTTINVVGSVDHVLKFLGNVKWDGLGKLTVNVNHNDKSDRSQSALCFPNAIPTLDNIDIIGANGTSVLVGLPYFGSGAPMNGQGSGKISNVRTFDCGKGVHVYGNANKDTIIITENLYTDPMTGYLNGLGQGGGGNTFYLSYHRQAKNIGGHFEHHPDSFGSNINRSLYGAYEGGFFQGADGVLSRGPTFGEDLEFGSIYGGGVSRNCGFSAISADIRKGDGSYPVSRVLIDGWHAIGCGRTLYSQAQDLSFGNIHTKESKASDFLFRINGASPKAVKQIGVITAFDCVNTPVFVWCDSVTSLYLRPELTIHDGTVNQNIPFVADNQSGTNSVIFEGTNYSTVSADYVVPNGQRRVDVNLTSAGAVTTLRLPAARYSNIKNSRYEIFVRGGNGTKILRLLVNNGDGTINGATTAVDIVPAAGAVVKRDVLSLGAGAYLLTT